MRKLLIAEFSSQNSDKINRFSVLTAELQNAEIFKATDQVFENRISNLTPEAL